MADQPSSSTPSGSKQATESKTAKSSSVEHNIFDTCYQCRKKITNTSLFILHCMHSSCRECLTKGSLNAVDFLCKCNRIVPKRKAIRLNRLICTKGNCQEKLSCKNAVQFHCVDCALTICDECSRSHNRHQMAAPPSEPQSCTDHPKMPAKYSCSCGKLVCHACATGYKVEHQRHQKQEVLANTRVIDSCERFNKGICTLQNTTQITFDLFAAERDKLKMNFHNMRVEVAAKTVEIVNATLRKMNDCILAMEQFETSFTNKFEENEREHQVKQQNMLNFKKLCSNTADNNPLNDFLPFITEVSTQISTDVSHFTNKLVEGIRAYSEPPVFAFDTKPVIDSINAAVKFRFKNQTVTPPARTDASVNLINVPIEKLAANPMVELSAGRRPGEKRAGGPLKDAIAAKKHVVEGPRPHIVAGTTINRRVHPIVPKQPEQRFPMHYDCSRFGPRENPKLPSNIRNPTVTVVSPFGISTTAGVVTAYNTPTYTIVSSKNIHGDRQGTSAQAHQRKFAFAPSAVASQMRNGIPPRVVHPQIVQQMPVRTMYRPNYIGANGMTANQMSGLPQPRAPIVASLRQGPPMMQKALDDIINQSSDNGKKPHPVLRQYASSIPDKTRVITPVVSAASTSNATPSSVNPPIKLTLRRNPPGASVSTDSSEKEGKRPTKIEDWDDYCFVCNQGCDATSGDLVCCETCPRVYHNVCHIPAINGDVKDLPDDWRCTRCDKSVTPLTEISDKFAEREKLVCARVMLACFEKKPGEVVSFGESFYHPVLPNARHADSVTATICFKYIAQRVSALEYQNVQQFIDDMNLVFKNCCSFNRKGTAIELACRVVYDFYSKAVKKFLPPYHSKIWLYQNSLKF